jgi:hypothetical protein
MIRRADDPQNRAEKSRRYAIAPPRAQRRAIDAISNRKLEIVKEHACRMSKARTQSIRRRCEEVCESARGTSSNSWFRRARLPVHTHLFRGLIPGKAW